MRVLLGTLALLAVAAPSARAGGSETRRCTAGIDAAVAPSRARGDVIAGPLAFMGGPHLRAPSRIARTGVYAWKVPVLLQAGRSARVSVLPADRASVGLSGARQRTTVAASRAAITFVGCAHARSGFGWSILTKRKSLCLALDVRSRGVTRRALLSLGTPGCP